MFYEGRKSLGVKDEHGQNLNAIHHRSITDTLEMSLSNKVKLIADSVFLKVHRYLLLITVEKVLRFVFSSVFVIRTLKLNA